ncbi:hypothetical protein BDY21DRAFT_365502 [Lineolata rhizophorae]|uniref:Pathogenesis associated protein Cap20 n=1 Tax=Lineolata rhizophorae TaxID=578093 RepID=A0A6A6NU66_9PEZI|nr:hypothetical protein BDY21DRAFT_365502 [Lineolata rhizophorae]
MPEPMTNGEKPSSQFLTHLTSYPVVSDSMTKYKTNPYGKKSLDLAHDVYAKFGAPLLPYLAGPYSYLAPYVAKADTLADSGLSKVDSRFPIVKEDTETLKGTAVGYARLPFRVAGQGRDYVFATYDSEYKKVGGEGVVKMAKAIVSTELKITADAWSAMLDFLGPKKEAAKQKYANSNSQ